MQKLLNIPKQHLIIFTRYPEPGKTKTRLIPALGEVGAADLQKQMTEHTILQVQELQKISAINVEVRFAGGNWELMQNWLGVGFVYQTQGEGDLGERMMRSLVDAFSNNAEQVIIIGTDCPGLNSHILASALEKLKVCDLVLGPALDGGYYLIGLRRVVPELFSQISWGTAKVFQETIEIAQKLNLLSGYLPSLADVDRPEDLPVWEQIFCR
ncbi:TIGR04282 family arsenosugar biosynthesis glycosyltransferase [Sphaerospermopsis torques-reginae]|uniref:TIGR04282 family arsenosugar biosynthesis glycosyltransferase n=1 Tax=Sphaerospermopsis torques-reginae ITEP-024 TaxID=984208 RepID=A0ABX8X682_9CYAN|nr:TIGR04282 family arsenosugar biosynthesis glycosyltransferase [Sphaerospermopsis torques-reginae]QYX34195.1 TIGR04282 family arsenosugar biosynthesis glycosyltransferase [Sphaerospermopsis torques-reginae ITEP-024]